MGSGDRMILEENASLHNSVTKLYSHAISDASVSWLSVCARVAVRLQFSWNRVLIWSKYSCVSIFRAEITFCPALYSQAAWAVLGHGGSIYADSMRKVFTANGKH